MVEHHQGNREIVIEKTDPRHTVYIFNCHNCVIQVPAIGVVRGGMVRGENLQRRWGNVKPPTHCQPPCRPQPRPPTLRFAARSTR